MTKIPKTACFKHQCIKCDDKVVPFDNTIQFLDHLCQNYYKYIIIIMRVVGLYNIKIGQILDICTSILYKYYVLDMKENVHFLNC